MNSLFLNNLHVKQIMAISPNWRFINLRIYWMSFQKFWYVVKDGLLESTPLFVGREVSLKENVIIEFWEVDFLADLHCVNAGVSHQ